MPDFSTKLDSSNNRQIKQYRDSITALSGTTQFGIPDALILTTGNTININALQYIQARGYILVNDPIVKTSGVSYVLTRDTDGVIVNTPLTGGTGGGGSDYTVSASFSASTGIIEFTRLSGSTYSVDISAYSGSTSGDNDDFTTGATFNSSNGLITFTRQSGSTYSVDIGAYSGSTGGGTDDYTTGATLTDTLLEFTRQSGSTYSVDLGSTFVPYTGATENVNLSGWSITANTIVLLDNQKEVTGNYVPIDSDYGKTIFLEDTINRTITVNTGKRDGFTTEFINVGTSTYTFVVGTATLNNPDGTNLLPNKICTLFKRNSDGEFWLKGELE